MNVGQFNKFRTDLDKKLHEPNCFNNVLGQVEQKTGIARFYIVAVFYKIGFASFLSLYLIIGYFNQLLCTLIGVIYPAYMSLLFLFFSGFGSAVVGSLSLYLIFGHFAELVCNCVGFLYPAYMSIKAIESVDKSDDTQWLTYWVVFALFNVVEFASDAIVGWFPFYWLCKCVLMLYLHLPITMGAQKLYTTYVRPYALKHQDAIDNNLGKAVGKATDVVRDQLNDFQQKRL